MKHILPLAALFLLAGCSMSTGPEIQFIGIGTGTLMTDVATMKFQQEFATDDTQLVAVVAFNRIVDGTTVQATWFSPDDRTMPLGRTSLQTQSGATVARFSFASREPWKAAPYQVRIDAFTGEGESMKTASGSLSFFIGMSERQIQAYVDEYEAWLEQERQQREDAALRQSGEDRIVTLAVDRMAGVERGIITQRGDFDGDGKDEYVIIPEPQEPFMGPGTPAGLLLSVHAEQAVVLDASGSVMLSLTRSGSKRVLSSVHGNLSVSLPRSGEAAISVLPSRTASVAWTDGSKHCTVELRWEDDAYAAGDTTCE